MLYRGTPQGVAYGPNALLMIFGATVSLTRVRDASETVMMADAAILNPITQTFGRSPFITWPRGQVDISMTSYRVQESIPTAGAANLPTIHARHGGRANVLWFDGHVTAEELTYAPTDYGTVETYKRLNLGHLVRGDIAPLEASYYFFVDKVRRNVL
jgi:prepilin-type processing-associated H-X9-DG protein